MILTAPFTTKKMFCSVYMVHATQNNRHMIKISTTKIELEKYALGPKILAKISLASWILEHFREYLNSQCTFLKTVFYLQRRMSMPKGTKGCLKTKFLFLTFGTLLWKPLIAANPKVVAASTLFSCDSNSRSPPFHLSVRACVCP